MPDDTTLAAHPAGPMSIPVAAPEERSLGLIAALGAAIARPASEPVAEATAKILSDRCGDRLAPEAFRAMMADPVFAPSMAAVSRIPGLADGLDDAFVQRLGIAPLSRLAVVLVTTEQAELDRLIALIAGIALQKRFLSAVTKAKRQTLENALPPEARAVATEEAPVLYAGLAPLGTLIGEVDAEAAYALGASVLVAWVCRVEPALERLLRRRLPAAANCPLPAEGIGEREQRLVEKLMMRKFDAWQSVVS